jgi:hypothetical protein
VIGWPSGRSASVRGRPDGELLELQAEIYRTVTTIWPDGHPQKPAGVVTVAPAEKPVVPVTHDARGVPPV